MEKLIAEQRDEEVLGLWPGIRRHDNSLRRLRQLTQGPLPVGGQSSIILIAWIRIARSSVSPISFQALVASVPQNPACTQMERSSRQNSVVG